MSRRFLSCLVVLGALLTTTACGGGGGGKTQFRVLQTSPDENAVDVLLDGTSVASGVTYAAPTNYSSVSSGSHSLKVRPTGSTADLIDEQITLNGGSNSTLVVANFASSITPILLTDDTTAPSSGDVKVRFLNVAPGLGNVDIYLVAPGSTPGLVAPTLPSLAFDTASGYQSFTAGSYEFFVTAAGNTFSYVDSGTITFTAGQNATLVALSNRIGGFTYVRLADLK